MKTASFVSLLQPRPVSPHEVVHVLTVTEHSATQEADSVLPVCPELCAYVRRAIYDSINTPAAAYSHCSIISQGFRNGALGHCCVDARRSAGLVLVTALMLQSKECIWPLPHTRIAVSNQVIENGALGHRRMGTSRSTSLVLLPAPALMLYYEI